MSSSSTTRRAALVPVAVVVLAALPACGAYNVETVAREEALDRLQANLSDAVTCLTGAVPELDATDDSGALAEKLADCADTGIFNRSEGFVLSDDAILRGQDRNMLISGVLAGDHLELHVSTGGSGFAEAGVASARSMLLTCWRVTADLETDMLREYAATSCNDALVARIRPTGQVPLAELVLPDRSHEVAR